MTALKFATDSFLHEYCFDFQLTGSVGNGAKNRADDVKNVQKALNLISKQWGGPELTLAENGKCDSRTIKAIRRFQKYHFGKSDGRIDKSKGTYRKIVQVMDGAVDIFIAQEPSSGEDSASVLVNDFWEGEIRTTSVTDMVDKIQRALRSDPGKRIMYLTIIGHGSPGNQRVGPGDWDGEHQLILKELVDWGAPAKGKEQKLGGQAETLLRRLSGFFHPMAVVTLAGCQVGGTETQSWGVVDGKNLLKAVSKALGDVAVQAGTAPQYDLTPGLEGTTIRCKGDACWIASGRGWWGPGDVAELYPN